MLCLFLKPLSKILFFRAQGSRNNILNLVRSYFILLPTTTNGFRTSSINIYTHPIKILSFFPVFFNMSENAIYHESLCTSKTAVFIEFSAQEKKGERIGSKLISPWSPSTAQRIVLLGPVNHVSRCASGHIWDFNKSVQSWLVNIGPSLFLLVGFFNES